MSTSTSTSITALHIQGQAPEAVEQALQAIFAGEERAQALRIEGTYSAVLARALDPDLAASYRYLILRPPLDVTWTPLLELGNRTVGLDVELSRALTGCAVFTTFVYGDVLSGYRLARGGTLIDEYLSDPTYLAEDDEEADPGAAPATPADVEAARGRPERFADLLPAGTEPADFVRVVLEPGWWAEHDSGAGLGTGDAVGMALGSELPEHGDEGTEGPIAVGAEDEDEDGEEEEEEEEIVDEVDRMRCLGLALELWGPTEYPFAQDPEEIPNKVAGPAIALAFA